VKKYKKPFNCVFSWKHFHQKLSKSVHADLRKSYSIQNGKTCDMFLRHSVGGTILSSYTAVISAEPIFLRTRKEEAAVNLLWIVSKADFTIQRC